MSNQVSDKIKAFKDKLFAAAKAKGFTDCEIFLGGRDSFTVQVLKGEISEYKNASAMGLSFRGTIKGKVGYASTERIADDVIDFLVDNAAGNAEIIESADMEELFPGDKAYAEVKTYEAALENVPVEDKIKKALAMEKAAFDTDSRVKGVDYNAVSTVSGYTFIANSLGLDIFRRSNGAFGYAMARVEQDGQFKSALDVWAGHNWNDFNPETVGKTAVGDAIKLLGAKPAPTGKYDAILDRDQASALLGVFWSALSADRVHKGFSLFKGKLGTKVAADHITVRDDALLDLKNGSKAFDDEGVATSNNVIIEKGILKTYLHNTKTAKKDGVKPTGNGAKQSYAAPLDIQPNNLYIQPTKTTKEELIKEMGNGIIITDLAGLHAGANPTSGDFSLLAGGFLVENGALSKPVEQITIAGNFFDLLTNIVKAGDDLDLNRTNIAAPSLWVKGISVSGV